MQSERLFEQAVQLAAAFAANGDIRLGGNMRPDSDAMMMLSDLIPSIYKALQAARVTVLHAAPPDR